MARLNKTFCHGPDKAYGPAQSEDQFINRVRMPANESFYSFKLNERKDNTEYDGNIHRLPYIRRNTLYDDPYFDEGYEDTTDF